MISLTNEINEISQTQNNLIQESISSTVSEDSSKLSNSDTISLAIGIPSFVIGIVSLIVTMWALYYAKREFIDKRKKKHQEEIVKREAELQRRMREGEKENNHVSAK